jgi:15-cis-phytoene synthase
MSRDTNFYYSFLVLSSEKRRAIIAVWDFCRAVDDAVDEPGGAGDVHASLGFWRAEVARVFDHGRAESAQGLALAPLVARFGLPRAPFDELIDGVGMDACPHRYATFDELRTYCYRVASTVGLICVEIFGYSNVRARDYAVELGIALQLTNILRDVPVDLARDRLYLPLEDLEAFGCSEDDLRAGRLTERTVALLRHQGARAREYYRRARSALPREDARRLVAAEIMGAIYRAILTRIEARGYDVFSEVVRVPRPRRAVIAATTWARVLAGAY